jgi:hypothetical protein
MGDGFQTAPQSRQQLLQPLLGNKYKGDHTIMKFNIKPTNHILIGGDIRPDGTIGELNNGNKD